MQAVSVAVVFALVTGLAAGPTSPQAPEKGVDELLEMVEPHVLRKVDFDLCYPSTREEYDALGKNAVVMLIASTVDTVELPLKSAFIETKRGRLALKEIAVFEKQERPSATAPKKTYIEQISFYLLPISAMERDSRLLVDFAVHREAFGIATFTARGGFKSGDVPPFIRGHEHEAPSEPDWRALVELLVREYPAQFGQLSE